MFVQTSETPPLIKKTMFLCVKNQKPDFAVRLFYYINLLTAFTK